MFAQALVSCVSIAICVSTADRVRWELVFDPMPDEPFERYANRVNKRIAAAVAASSSSQRNAVDPDAVGWRSTRGNGGGVGDVQLVKATSLCDCTLSHGTINLSDGHYPKRLLSFTCRTSHPCTEVMYPVLVLKRKNKGVATVAPGGLQNAVPDDLKNDWTFVQFNVTAGCSCPSIVVK